jgi:hypothetical protein
MTTPSDSVNAYISKLEALAGHNKRYEWLIKYLQRDREFLETHLFPVYQGATRAIVADFSSKPAEVSVRTFYGADDSKALGEALETRESQTQVRLIFATSISGIGNDARKEVGEI